MLRMPTRLLPGLQDAIAGDGELEEFSQQQQFPIWLIVCGSAMLQVAETSNGQPCIKPVSKRKETTNFLKNVLYMTILRDVTKYCQICL